MLPTEDLQFASAHNLVFSAAIKERRGAAWCDVGTMLPLEEAYRLAVSTEAFERAVFVETKSGGGMYWTSRFPTTFNSVALQHALLI
jgi:hypothetical protein